MCSSLGPYIYGIINDYNRIMPVYINETGNSSNSTNHTIEGEVSKI